VSIPERRALSSVAVRVAEIRSENHQGDVSANDIEWLCGVASAAARFALYAAEWPQDISGPLAADFLPILRRALERT